MKKSYKIEVDCANCANKIEEAVKKMDGIADASVNFMTQKMTISFAEGADPAVVMPAVAKRVRDVEEECVIRF